MIWVSSTGVRAARITDSIRTLVDAGFRHVELSGGSEPYPELENELEALAEAGIGLQLHNYFPPPPEPFVLNLASLDTRVREQSITHCLRALDLSHRLGARRYGVHAGFLFDVPPSELGGALGDRPLVDKDAALEAFVSALATLSAAAGDVRLYVENNVLSARNRQTWPGANPLLLCRAADWRELRPLLQPLGIGLLLDLAHLRVSATSLGLDFRAEAEELLAATDCLHLSDNDGLRDNNGPLTADGPVMQALRGLDQPPASVTLEVYTGLPDITTSADLLEELWPGLRKETDDAP